jgi:predicted metal-dependent phosphoesterase TrpH
MSSNRIDLHIHSTASDGVYTPSEIVYMAGERRLETIALTDHDSVAGLPEARTAAAGTGLTVLSGVELPTSLEDPTFPRGVRTVDILGYLFDAEYRPLLHMLRTIRETRLRRAAQMVDKLNALDMAITYARVQEIAGSGAVGRPHVAQALLEAGYVASLKEAFDRYLGDDGPAYVARYRLAPREAIALLHAAGGVAVLAHPIRLPACRALIPALVAYGLDGLEAYYPDHDAAFTSEMEALAHRHGLIVTGGSDLHREVENLGQQPVPPECVDQLRERAAQYRTP